MPSVNGNNKKIEVIKLINDTGWITLTPASNFETYSSGFEPKIRKINKVVYLQGALKPISTINAGMSTTMFTLPTGYRPDKEMQFVCQGSDVNKWVLTVQPVGNCKVQRYGTTSNMAIPGGTWLPFSVSFPVN